MKSFGIITYFILIPVLLLLSGCQNNEPDRSTELKYDTNDPYTMAQAVLKACGGQVELYDRHDVQYSLNYILHDDSVTISSSEKYIFENEISWARYENHPGFNHSTVIQLHDYPETFMIVEDSLVNDSSLLAEAKMRRKINYFWFTIFFKLDDPGTAYDFVGKSVLGTVDYDILKVTFGEDNSNTEKFLLYINPKTMLADYIFFSSPRRGIHDPVVKMELVYETISSFKIPVERHLYFPDEKGSYMDKPDITHILSNISFNNSLSISRLKEPFQ